MEPNPLRCPHCGQLLSDEWLDQELTRRTREATIRYEKATLARLELEKYKEKGGVK